MMIPKEAQRPQGAVDCQHHRLHVSYAKEEGKKGDPLGLAVLLLIQPAGKGLASQDPVMVLPRDDEKTAQGVTAVPSMAPAP